MSQKENDVTRKNLYTRNFFDLEYMQVPETNQNTEQLDGSELEPNSAMLELGQVVA